jgi:hypothetical protein
MRRRGSGFPRREDAEERCGYNMEKERARKDVDVRGERDLAVFGESVWRG